MSARSLHTRIGSDHYYGSAPLRHHRRCRGLHAVIGAGQVRVDDPFPFFLRAGHYELSARNPCITEQDIEATALSFDGFDEGLYLMTRAYVCLIERSLSMDLRNKRQGLCRLLGMVEVVHADPPAGTGKGKTESAPDSTGTAGNQHGPVFVRVLS